MSDPAHTRTSATVASASFNSGLSSSSSVDEGRFVPGTLIAGRYRIISLLGRGGMGEVYRATDLTLGQAVALKFLPDSGTGLLERFQNEVRVARQVSHPNVCRVYDLGEFDGMPYMSMEYVDGEDLSGLLARIGRLPSDKALDIARKLCAGLAAAHDKGVIHRDLKPANIMLDKRGNAVIMDFGLAAVASELRGPEAKSGSPAYQAPEQLRGEEVTARSDIYALGLVLYELFTGKRAFDPKSVQELIRLQEEAQLPSMTTVAADIDPAVEKVIKRCLAPLATQRPASALSVSAQLPGGDPLAAALAAGEMPSPELVAASGKSEGLSLKYSAPLALALVLFCVAVPFFRHNTELHSIIPLDLPPEALAVKAHEFVVAFGYPAAPVDTYSRLDWLSDSVGQAVQRSTKQTDKLDALRKWYHAESPLLFTYRQSPTPLTTNDGWIYQSHPAPLTSGMVQVSLTSAGELRSFSAVPTQTDGSPASVPIDSSLISQAIGFDLSHFEPVTPQFTPLYAFDWQAAWKGKHPSLDLDLTVEAAAWHGKLTHLVIRWPWTVPDRMPVDKRNVPSALIDIALTAIVFLLSGFFAIRNIRAAVGDLKGAFRITAFVFLLRAITWIGLAHWNTDLGSVYVFADMMGNIFARSAIIWLLYVALEPAVRGRWPGVLVSWNRILQGRWNDPLVGSHILQGTAVGFVIYCFFLLDTSSSAHSGFLGTVNSQTGLNIRLYLASMATMIKDGIEFGLAFVLGVSWFRLILHRDWLACLVLAVIVSIYEKKSELALVPVLFFIVVFFVLGMVLLRLGLTATMISTTMLNTLAHTPGAQDLSKWYEWTVIAYPLTAVAIIAWAFWQCSGTEALTIKSQET